MARSRATRNPALPVSSAGSPPSESATASTAPDRARVPYPTRSEPSPPADARGAALDRVVRERSREDRARIVRRGDYEALLVRGSKVNNPAQLRNLVIVVLGGFFGSILTIGAGITLASQIAVAAAVLYALVWLFLVVTGGEEFNLVRADESGHVTIARTGRLVETRGIVLRIGVPAVVLVASAVLGASTLVTLTHPPATSCNAWPAVLEQRPDACLVITDPSSTMDPATGHAGVGAIFSVSDVKTFDAIGRLLQLVLESVAAIIAGLFLWAMFTGRHFLVISPIEWPRGRRE